MAPHRKRIIPLDLTSRERLRLTSERASARLDRDRVGRLAALLREAHRATLEERAGYGFQSRIWLGELVWKGHPRGQEAAGTSLRDAGFRTWFANKTMEQLPSGGSDRTAALRRLLKAIFEKIKRCEPRRNRPLQSTLRALAIFFPTDFTGVAREEARMDLLRAMGERGNEDDLVEPNRKILSRLTEVIGATDPDDQNAVAERILLTVELARLTQSHKSVTDAV